jgi:hypothetical protein
MEVTLHKLSGAKGRETWVNWTFLVFFPIHIQVGSPYVISKGTMHL